MSTILTDFKFFIEHDSNPFILFSSGGQVRYLNQSAELLMGMNRARELYQLAIAHAPKTFGQRRTLLDLSCNPYDFYAINVLYENEDEIGLHLYDRPKARIAERHQLEGYTLTDINLLLHANIELFNTGYDGKLSLFADYALPEFQLHQNRFSFLLRKIFAQFQDAVTMDITMKLKIDAWIKIADKKHPIILLEITGRERHTDEDKGIGELAQENYINSDFTPETITLEIPAIR